MAVNDMLTPREQTVKISDRQVEEHPRCFLFGHYDSRGGATLVRAKNLLEAFAKYAESFGWTVDEKTGRLEDEGMRQYMKSEAEYEAWKPDALHGLMEEDFMFSCNVVVCDEPFGEKEELDHGYTGDADSSDYGYEGYRYGVLQYRWKHKKAYAETEAEREEFSKWANVSKGCRKTLVFWKGKERPQIDTAALGMGYLDGLEVRIVKKSYGEDACGVIWQT
jgi:hypothetical protein